MRGRWYYGCGGFEVVGGEVGGGGGWGNKVLWSKENMLAFCDDVQVV